MMSEAGGDGGARRRREEGGGMRVRESGVRSERGRGEARRSPNIDNYGNPSNTANWAFKGCENTK